MNSTIRFIIVTYHPNPRILSALAKAIAGRQIGIIDNSKKNLGYGGAANRDIQTASKDGGEWTVVMNQDLSSTKKGIEAFAKTLNASPPGIVGPFAGGLEDRRWTTILPSNHTDYISGACMAIHRDVIEKIGYFYEPYFIYYEDVDYCIRAKRAGFPLTHAPITDIRHDDNLSLGKGSFLHQYYLARNHLLFVERNAPLRVELLEVLRILKTVQEHRKRREFGALHGIRDYFLRKFGPLKQSGNLDK